MFIKKIRIKFYLPFLLWKPERKHEIKIRCCLVTENRFRQKKKKKNRSPFEARFGKIKLMMTISVKAKETS